LLLDQDIRRYGDSPPEGAMFDNTAALSDSPTVVAAGW